VLHVVDQQQFDPAALALGQATTGGLDDGGFKGGQGSTPDAMWNVGER
jgi:hypothetical protein